MRVILFGAGASYGCGVVNPTPPPLGSRLFAALRSAHPSAWGAIDGRLGPEFESSFESGMGALLASGTHAVPVFMQTMALFFAAFRSLSPNAYRDLVDLLDAAGKLRDTAFASLNYECLFEVAASVPGRPVNYFGQHDPSWPNVTVWKLHGSCNFLPGDEITATRGVTFSAGVSFNTSVRAVDPAQVPAYCLSNTALYPAMAHYAPGKEVQIAQPVIQRLQATYAEAVGKAATVAVIGVRPNPEDRHVWRPLASTPAELLVIGDEETTMRWTANHRVARPTRHLGSLFDRQLKTLLEPYKEFVITSPCYVAKRANFSR